MFLGVLGVVLVSGCVVNDPTQLAMQTPAVSQFLHEYPNSEVRIVHYSKDEANGILGEIGADCGKPTVTPREYYLVNVSDAGSGLYITAWVNWEDRLVECAVKKGTIVQPEIPVIETPETPTIPESPEGAVFLADFSNGFPGSKWEYEGDQFPEIDQTVGNPGPSLRWPLLYWPPKENTTTPLVDSNVPRGITTPRITNPTFKITTATNPFESSNGMTASADIAIDMPQSTGSTHDVTFSIRNTNWRNANAKVDLARWSGNIRYTICKGSDPIRLDCQVTMAPLMVGDTGFHMFTFSVDAEGNAQWMRDGIVKATNTGFASGQYVIDLEGTNSFSGQPTGSQMGSYFWVDNVKVESPV
jgi:hypothetical protein